MSRKVNRLRGRLQIAMGQMASGLAEKNELLCKSIVELQKQLAASQRRVQELEKIAADPAYSAFRIAIHDMRARAGDRLIFSDDQFALQVCFSQRELLHAMMGSQRDLFDMSRIVHYHCEEMAYRCRQAIMDHLTKETAGVFR